jgi:hypothetical protein
VLISPFVLHALLLIAKNYVPVGYSLNLKPHRQQQR